PPTPERGFTGAKINIFFEITNIFQEKSHFGAKKVIFLLKNNLISTYNDINCRFIGFSPNTPFSCKALYII
ncbi:MAG: hypothetical protein IJ868_03210, partial [Prevotella sp.]|nr:hypothetical protein [Prevotella sp.]